jgi:hypothetical protein
MDVSSQLEALAALPWGRALNTFGQETGWTPEPIWALWRRENCLILPGFEAQFNGRPLRCLAKVLTEISSVFCDLKLAEKRSELCFLHLMKRYRSVHIM